MKKLAKRRFSAATTGRSSSSSSSRSSSTTSRSSSSSSSRSSSSSTSRVSSSSSSRPSSSYTSSSSSSYSRPSSFSSSSSYTSSSNSSYSRPSYSSSSYQYSSSSTATEDPELRLLREREERLAAEMRRLERVKLDVRRRVQLHEQKLRGLITLHRRVVDVIDWQHIAKLNAPYNPAGIGREEYRVRVEAQRYEPSFFDKLFPSSLQASQEKLIRQIKKARELDQADYALWEELHVLADKMLAMDGQSALRVLNDANIFTEYAKGSKLAFNANTGHSPSLEGTLRVDFKEMVPSYRLRASSDGLSVVETGMDLAEYDGIVLTHISSCAVAIAHEVFSLVPQNHIIVNIHDTRIGGVIFSVELMRKELMTVIENSYMHEFIRSCNHRIAYDATAHTFGIVEPFALKEGE